MQFPGANPSTDRLRVATDPSGCFRHRHHCS
jgi:hypothetical protein